MGLVGRAWLSVLATEELPQCSAAGKRLAGVARAFPSA